MSMLPTVIGSFFISHIRWGQAAGAKRGFGPPGYNSCILLCGFLQILTVNIYQLSLVKADNREDVGEISAKIRKAIERTVIPKGIDNEITRHIAQLGEKNAYAVRSSATAEDLLTASFAGQQDTYLNIIGKEAILKHIIKCWASLFTDRAVIYRIQNGFGHRKVHLSVVIQKMVFPEAAGIMLKQQHFHRRPVK